MMCSLFYILLHVVPSTVVNLTSDTGYSSVLLNWSPPSQPNGVIITYEVTYRVNSSTLVVTNTSRRNTRFTISSLTPLTRVSDISVRAYTIEGHGEAMQIPDLLISQPRKYYS